MRTTVMALVWIAVAGCRRDPGPAVAPSSGNPAAEPRVTGGKESPAAVETPPMLDRVPSNCPDETVVTAGGDGTPEGVIFDAYGLALGEDTEAAREAFYRLFVQGAPKDHILQNIWPRVREHVGKYVADPTKPAYTLCRRVPLATDRVKIFVRCRDARKSDPPSVLILEQGKWRLDVMTP